MLDVAGLFGDHLARARKSADISQEELGVMASVHRTEISQLERGLRIARVDTLAKLCGSLEVDPGELMAGRLCPPSAFVCAVGRRGEVQLHSSLLGRRVGP
jgi:transcriptional regulator with XRE-family HTH domain